MKLVKKEGRQSDTKRERHIYTRTKMRRGRRRTGVDGGVAEIVGRNPAAGPYYIRRENLCCAIIHIVGPAAEGGGPPGGPINPHLLSY